MTQDEIISMAHEAEIYVVRPDEFQNLCIKDLERFAKLVAAHEREACAKVADAISDKYGWGYYGNEVDTADEIADAIRAREKTFEPCPFIECGCDGNHPLGQGVIKR